MNTDVSIIVPVYNTQKYLEQCIESILSETEVQTEIIIIDDASTDNSMEIIKDFASKDKRIKLVSLKHNSAGGAGIPSNMGIDEASGKYIGFVDSDDWIKSGMFFELYCEAEKTQSDFVFCDFIQFHSKKNTIIEAYDKDLYPDKNNYYVNTNFLMISPVPWRKLYRRDFLLKNNLKFPEGDYFFEDTPFHFMVTLKADKISYIDKPLYYHRIFREEQTMFGKGDRFMAFIEHNKTMYNFLVENNWLSRYGREYILYVSDNFFWVWDRLNRSNRRMFFDSLRNMFKGIPDDVICNFFEVEDFFNRLRLKLILNNHFMAYKDLMFTYKNPLGIFKRNIHFIREHGIGAFPEKVLNKLKILKN